MTAPAPRRPEARLVRWLRLAWLTLLLAAIAVMLADGIALIAGASSIVLPSVLAVAGLIPASATCGLIATRVMGRGRLWEFMLASMVATVLAVVGWCVLIVLAVVDEPVKEVWPYKLLATLSMIALGVPILGTLLTSADRRRPLVVARALVVGSLILTGASLLLLMWSVWWQSLWIVLAAMLGIGVVGSGASSAALLAISILLRARVKAAAGSLPRGTRVTLVCPQCEHEQSLPQGPVRCARCNLSMILHVEEPRCACGYLLFRLEGERCPECGRLP